MTAISFNGKAIYRTVDSYGYHAGGNAMWLPTTFYGVTVDGGDSVWTDGTDIYYVDSVPDTTYKLDKETKTWSHSDVGFDWDSTGRYSVFHDGDITYACYNNSNIHRVYQFDDSTKKFSTYYNQEYPTGEDDIWYNGGDIYHSANTGIVGDPAHNLKWNRSTHMWEPVAMYFNPSLYGTYGLVGNAVWNYKGDSYVGDWDYDGNFLRLYKFNHSTSTWNETSWNGFCAVKGIDIWDDYDGNIIYSTPSAQYKLNASNDMWEPYDRWYVRPNPGYGRYVWTDGDYIYHSVRQHNPEHGKDYVLVR